MPQFQPLSSILHLQWRMNLPTCSREALLCLSWQELWEWQKNGVIGFARVDDVYLPVAILGLHNGQNLYPESSTFSSVLCEGFELQPNVQGSFNVLIDQESARFVQNGAQALFYESGEPSGDLTRILELLKQHLSDQSLFKQLSHELDALGLFEPWLYSFKTPIGDLFIDGLFQISQKQLGELTAQQQHQLGSSQAKQLVDIHLASIVNADSLVQRLMTFPIQAQLNPSKLTSYAVPESQKVLIVSHLWDVACELPQLFVEAGFEVDVLCPEKNCARKGGYHDQWFDAGSTQDVLLVRLYQLVQSERYVRVVLCDDPLLWRISSQPITPLLSLLPVQGQSRRIMEKIAFAAFCAEHQIPSPKFAVVRQSSDWPAAADVIGFPLMIKPNFSNGGQGIIICNSEAEYQKARPSLAHHAGYLVQEYLIGKLVSVEALFRKGRLLEYATSYAYSEALGPSTRRIYQDKDNRLTELLSNFGKVSGLDGFANMSLIQAPNGQYGLFEADPRPNRWVAFGKWFAADFAKAIQNWLNPVNPGEIGWKPMSAESIRIIESMPLYATELINQGRLLDALLHLTDYDHTWRYLKDDPIQLEQRLRILHRALKRAIES